MMSLHKDVCMCLGHRSNSKPTVYVQVVASTACRVIELTQDTLARIRKYLVYMCVCELHLLHAQIVALCVCTYVDHPHAC